MFPMQFDHRVLATLPMPAEDRIRHISQLLLSIIARRIVPYFRNQRGTEPIKLGRLVEQVSILRLEDEENRIGVVSILTRTDRRWEIKIHERIFDYFSFVIPSDPESRLGSGPPEEMKMLAFVEFFLRHQVEHVLYPEKGEREVVITDGEFAHDRLKNDPTFYRMLCQALSDEMNGLKGKQYLELFDQIEQGFPTDSLVGSILGDLVGGLVSVPLPLLREAFRDLDPEIKGRLISEHYRRSRNTASSLLVRTQSLRTALNLLSILVNSNWHEALTVFQVFKEHWGIVELCRELEIPEVVVNGRSTDELLRLLKDALPAHLHEDTAVFPVRGPAAVPKETVKGPERVEKSLKDRIEEARNNPAFPLQVIETIEKNRVNAIGHSGSKYSELIETLLAIPWGKITKIAVSAQAFEEGLNRSHYGIQTPKEIICDFFSNLIYRYQHFSEAVAPGWKRTGSAFLLVGPPGVGKTSLAISVAQNLGIPYHKISLGGMRDEADLRGHSFTYEGSKPGAIVQGLIKMQVMNGMFILDEADKTEKFAIATLLEILDPEQNHLFHDKYTQTSVDIDLSNCHFFLTANTLDGVPPVVVNRCELIFLDQYSVEEKIIIAREHLLGRIREKYQISESEIAFDREEQTDLLRYLIRTYTYEAGVRELERVLRKLFLRIQRKEILGRGKRTVTITREEIKKYLREPTPPRQISAEDAVGEMLALGVDLERGIGSIIPIQATRIGVGVSSGEVQRGFLSVVHATGNIQKIMDESRKVATTGIVNCAEQLGLKLRESDEPIHLHFMGGSTKKDGPSAGGSIALALTSLLTGRRVRRDVAMTGEIDTKGRISMVGALALKIETAVNAGCKTVIIPRENLWGEGGIERFPEALKAELQILEYNKWVGTHDPFDYSRHVLEVVAVDHIVQAAQVALIDDAEIERLVTSFDVHAREAAEELARVSGGARQSSRIIQVKNHSELDLNFLTIFGRKAQSKTHLLMHPELEPDLLPRLSMLDEPFPVMLFDPKRERLFDCVHGLLDSLKDQSDPSFHIGIIAPYYFLKRDGISEKQFSLPSWCEGITLFANNFTAQMVKIKNCKTILNSVFTVLSHLGSSTLNACPFLTRLDEIYVIDMNFIPEKYRLDVLRAEKIISQALEHWLATVCKSWLQFSQNTN